MKTEDHLPHVRLRAMEPEDLDLLYRIENDIELWGVSSTNVPYSRYTLHDYIANSSGDIYTDRQVRLIIENAEGQTVGIADLVNFDAKNQRAELGLVIERAHRHQGYARSTLYQLAHYALHVIHLHQLYVVISTDNLSCISLFQQMGYQTTATLKDWLFDGHNYHDAVLMQTFF
jgi:diamine N-acetyltransferase